MQKSRVDTMRSLMPFLRSLNWICIYRREAFLDHFPIIKFFSGYILDRNRSLANPDRSEWVPTSLCEKPRSYYPKESVPDPRNLIVIWDVIVVLWFPTHTVFTGVLSDVLGYYSSLLMISAQTCTSKRCLPVHYWITVAFLTPFLCVQNSRDTLSARCIQPLLCSRLRRFL